MKGMKRRAMRKKKAAAAEEAPMKAMRRKGAFLGPSPQTVQGFAAKRREPVRRRPRARPDGRVLRRWHPCRRPCGAANGRAPAARSLAFGLWGVLHFRECWRRLGGGGPIRGAGVFGTLICTF